MPHHTGRTVRTSSGWDEYTKRAIADGEKREACKHPSYTMDRVTGDCHCDDCGKLLIDCLGTVLE
jgi:hypothetical protein